MAKNRIAKVFDGMALGNALKKGKEIKTCQDLGELFMERIYFLSNGFDEVCLIFDQCSNNERM